MLIFPLDYLRNDAPETTPKKRAIVFTADAPGEAVEFGFFYSRETVETLEPKLAQIGQPLFQVTLENGEAIHVIARIRRFDAAVLPSSEKMSAEGMTPLNPKALPKPGAEQTDLNAVLWNAPEDGETFQILEIGGVTLRRNVSAEDRST